MCSCLFIEMNQTAHISLQCIQFSNSTGSKTPKTIKTQCALTSWRARPVISQIFLVRLVAYRLQSGPSGAPSVHRCASGEVGSRVITQNPQDLFDDKFKKVSHFWFFSIKHGYLHKNWAISCLNSRQKQNNWGGGLRFAGK